MDQRSAERAALGALLLGLDGSVKFLASDFVIPAYQQIFAAIQALKEARQPIDAGTVYESMALEGSEAKPVLALLGTIVKDMPTGAELLEALRRGKVLT